MTDGSSRSARRGWLAPRSGGYTFKARRTQSGRKAAPTPPSGSAGVGNFNRNGESKRRSED